MRVAYADPPYIGQAKRHYVDHPDYAGEVDHRELIQDRLAEFDAWALSATSKSLAELLALCPSGVRVMAWAKTNPTLLLPNGRLMHAWEPVIIHRRVPRPCDALVMRDWVVCARVSKNTSNTKGSKPQEFCYWLFDALAVGPDDEFHDLFPGDGAVTRHLSAWRSQTRLPTMSTKATLGRGQDKLFDKDEVAS